MEPTSKVSLPRRKRYPINGPRSHGACVSCKRAHVKCDEKSPVCSRCAKISLSCAYEDLFKRSERRSRKATEYCAILPLEQYTIPGSANTAVTKLSCSRKLLDNQSQVQGQLIHAYAEHEQLWSKTPLASAPIFQLGNLPNCFSVQMPYKSDELFDYFYGLPDSPNATIIEKRKNRLTFNMQSGDAFRNTMLIAGLHYTWKTGSTKFIPALLFHKIEAMRLVNEGLGQTNPSYGACVRQIATLCLIECALGDIRTSETHLNGLVRFIDAYKPLYSSQEFKLQEEISNRYVTLIYGLTLGFKNHGQDISDSYHCPGSTYRFSPAAFENMMQRSREGNCPCLESRLQTLQLLPFFLDGSPSTAKFRDIDSTSILDCLVALTKPSLVGTGPGEQPKRAGTDFLLKFAESHVESISDGDDSSPIYDTQTHMRSSWSGLCSASTIYLHVILELGMQGGPMESSLYNHIISDLKGDLNSVHYGTYRNSCPASDLWFWKAFVGALSIEMRSNSDGERLSASRGSFHKFVYDWSITSGVTSWYRARASLASIVWPVSGRAVNIAEDLWYNCIT